MGQSLSTSITIAVGHKVLLLSFLILLAGSLPSSSVGPHAVAATPDSPALSSGSESPSLSQDGFGGQEDDSTLEFPEEQEKGGLVGLGLMMDDEAPGGFEDSKQQDKGGKAHQSRASSPGKPTRGHAVRQSFRDMRKDVSAGKKQAKRKNSSSGSAEVGGEYKSLEQTESRLEFKLQNNLGSVDESGDGLVELSYEKRSEYHGKGTYYKPEKGACGWTNDGSDLVAALSKQQYGRGGHCGKWAKVCHNGNCVRVQIVDECPGCDFGSLDMSPRAFTVLAPAKEGVISIHWHWD